jgi:hypothetical protein
MERHTARGWALRVASDFGNARLEKEKESVMHFLVGVVVIYLLWSHPVARALLLIALTALLCFAFLPAVVAWIITTVVAVGISVEAREALRARRQWLDDEALLRRAALTRARRTLLK